MKATSVIFFLLTTSEQKSNPILYFIKGLKKKKNCIRAQPGVLIVKGTNPLMGDKPKRNSEALRNWKWKIWLISLCQRIRDVHHTHLVIYATLFWILKLNTFKFERQLEFKSWACSLLTGGGEGHLPTHPKKKKKKSLLHLELLFRTVFTCLRLAALFTEIAIKNWAYYM